MPTSHPTAKSLPSGFPQICTKDRSPPPHQERGVLCCHAENPGSNPPPPPPKGSQGTSVVKARSGVVQPWTAFVAPSEEGGDDSPGPSGHGGSPAAPLPSPGGKSCGRSEPFGESLPGRSEASDPAQQGITQPPQPHGPVSPCKAGKDARADSSFSLQGSSLGTSGQALLGSRGVCFSWLGGAALLHSRDVAVGR